MELMWHYGHKLLDWNAAILHTHPIVPRYCERCKPENETNQYDCHWIASLTMITHQLQTTAGGL